VIRKRADGRSRAYSGEQPNVYCSLTSPTRVILNLKFQFLPFAQGVEYPRRQRRVVHENFFPTLRVDEPEPTISNESND
jgi:hypothetical protein